MPMLAYRIDRRTALLAWPLAACFLLIASCVGSGQDADIGFLSEASSDSAPFDGGVYSLVVRSNPAKRIHILELDLDKVKFEVTPGDTSLGREFVAQTPSAYLAKYSLQAAVNGGYFTPFKGGSRAGEDYYPHTGDAVDVSGASISGEVVASPVETNEDQRVNAVICIEGRAVEIRDGQICAAATDYALAAGPRLLSSGLANGFDAYGADYAKASHPRTALGLSDDHKTAWLVVVDGRQAGFSEGASLSELTELFVSLGASDAINLDGGGSSTMVVSSLDGPRVLNSPIHTGVPGRERPSANHLGVRTERQPS